MTGGIGKGKLEPVGFCKKNTDLFVSPVHRGQVLQENQQFLGGGGKGENRKKKYSVKCFGAEPELAAG